MRDQTFMTSTQKWSEVLKFALCLQILLLLNNISIVHFCKLGMGAVVKKLVIFCGRYHCMIPNVKKVLFLALVPMLQWNSHPHFLVYVLSEWKVS